ncbi:hypothetical protein CP532_2201 [Ophiocordyceps camponoti-leonardi (nom. inval.)]|nr:hypothetical protein CP532_2201 [Ophiocordyceps camponoti-leonardi (nom. inval.)]
MTDFASLKVPELKKLLAEKKLPQSGNKADLIARLQESENDVEEAEIEADQVEEQSATESKVADVNEPQQQQQQSDAQEKQQQQPAPVSDETAAEKVDEVAQKEEPAPSFALGLSTTAADAEAKKRVDRAKRFGIEEDDEYKKRADRAKRFGIDDSAIASTLDAALPDRVPKRGRGREADGDDAGRGKRQNVQRQNVQRQNNQRQNNQRQNDQRRVTRQSRNNGAARNGGSVLDDPVERAKAEKRAARFAAA